MPYNLLCYDADYSRNGEHEKYRKLKSTNPKLHRLAEYQVDMQRTAVSLYRVAQNVSSIITKPY